MTELPARTGTGDPVAQALPPILTVEQAADLLQMSIPGLRRLARDGEVPARRVGGQWRFSRDRLLEYISGTD